MGAGLVLCFFLGSLWGLLELIFGLLPNIRKQPLRIGLVIGIFPLSLFVIVFTSLMTLGLLRGGELPSSYGQVIANVALILAVVFPSVMTFIAFDRYRKVRAIESVRSEEEKDGT